MVNDPLRDLAGSQRDAVSRQGSVADTVGEDEQCGMGVTMR